jgi:hypothetical protein
MDAYTPGYAASINGTLCECHHASFDEAYKMHAYVPRKIGGNADYITKRESLVIALVQCVAKADEILTHITESPIMGPYLIAESMNQPVVPFVYGDIAVTYFPPQTFSIASLTTEA